MIKKKRKQIRKKRKVPVYGIYKIVFTLSPIVLWWILVMIHESVFVFVWVQYLLMRCLLQINLIAPPRYVMTTTTLERTEGLSMLNQAMAAIKERIEEKRGVFNIQMEVHD